MPIVHTLPPERRLRPVCGLVAFVSVDSQAITRFDDVNEALGCSNHRGPDDRGVWCDLDVVLGFNRLSIIDVEGSTQPMSYANGRYRIVFNGEIYNYLELRAELTRDFGAAFLTDGDTESIVAAYHYLGEACLDRLRGMFAFVIWDIVEQKAFGARDPFGIKPLYISEGPSGVYLASEKKTLMQLRGQEVGRVDRRSLQHYFMLQYVPEPASMHEGIRRLESGTCFTVVDGRLRTRRYFTPDFRVRSVRDCNRATLNRRIRHALEESVRVHMRADVAVGAFLSGGIDSTALVALAKQHNPALMAFTVGFDQPGYSEIDVAAESAAAIGVAHLTRLVTPDEFASAMPDIVWYLDDPVADPSLVPLWFIAREARKHVKVVLSGEGADELFGGYNIYREPRSLAAFGALPPDLRHWLGMLSDQIPAGVRGKDLLRRGSIPLEERYYGNARICRDEDLGFLHTYDPAVSVTDVTAPLYATARARGYDDVTAMQYVDLFTWLRGDILVKADRMAMANSLELRVPFLDLNVFDVAGTLPIQERVTRRETKYALRQALRDVVPPHVLHRRKLGFPVPLGAWLAGELYDWARELILESETDSMIARGEILAMLDAHRRGSIDHSRKLWAVLVFMIWHGIFVEERIIPASSKADQLAPVRALRDARPVRRSASGMTAAAIDPSAA